MPADTIHLGPFVKGLNTFSDPTSIDDLELCVMDNFDLDVDGSLVNRPPLHNLGTPLTVPTDGKMQLLGFFSTGQATYLIASDGVSSTYYYTGSSWTLITNTVSAAALAQYRDKAWLVAPPGSANPGGSWTPSGGFTAVPTMPKGRCIAVQKERLWIGAGRGVTSNGSRVYFCAVANPESWPGDFISINTGDGQNVVDVVVYFQDLLVFKEGSTYRFSFDLDPASGNVSRVSDTVGALEANCVAQFENRIFVLHDNNLYELSNYSYERLNDRVPFERGSPDNLLATTACMSYFSNRIFVSFYGNLYVWSVKTRTWATWSSTVVEDIGRVLAIPGRQALEATAYLQSNTRGNHGLYTITDDIGAGTEQMTCTMTTKNYDYQNASSYKKLTMWGLDCLARADITGIATPVQYATSATWGDVLSRTWGDALAFTWGRPVGGDVSRVDPVAIGGVTGERKYIKLGDRALRFRQIGFTIKMETDGSFANAPARVYKLTTYVSEKQGVVKKIS